MQATYSLLGGSRGKLARVRSHVRSGLTVPRFQPTSYTNLLRWEERDLNTQIMKDARKLFQDALTFSPKHGCNVSRCCHEFFNFAASFPTKQSKVNRSTSYGTFEKITEKLSRLLCCCFSSEESRCQQTATWYKQKKRGQTATLRLI